MNLLMQMIVGGLAGWLTGKAVAAEGRTRSVRERHPWDLLYGAVGGVLGKYMLYWTVIGNGDAFTDFATAALGAVIAVGAARLVRSRMPSRRQI